MLHGVVRSTGRQASAALSALVRTRLPGAVRSDVRGRSAGAHARAEIPGRWVVHRAVREPVDGEAGTGKARRVAEPSRGDARSRRSRPGRARRAPRRARRAAPARGGHGGHRHNAVEASHERVVPAAAGSAASRRANGVRSDRRERRRQGLQWKSERSGDWSGKPGREAGRPDSSSGSPHRHPTSAPWSSSASSSAPSWSPILEPPSPSASSPSRDEHRRRWRPHGERD